MVYQTARSGGGGSFGLGFGGPPPRDIVAVLVAIFVTFTLQFFAATAIIPALLRLTPGVFRGMVWQLATNPFVGTGGASLWFLLELLILYWFGRDVFWRLGRRRFWRAVLLAAVGSALVAVLVQGLLMLAGFSPPLAVAFSILQGQRLLLAILIAAFATLYADATILLFFILPIRARWFLWIEVLFAFLAYLNSKDLAGFLGVCAAVLITYVHLTGGGFGRHLHRWRKEVERKILEQRLRRMRSKRRFDVIDGDDRGGNGPDRWLH